MKRESLFREGAWQDIAVGIQHCDAQRIPQHGQGRGTDHARDAGDSVGLDDDQFVRLGADPVEKGIHVEARREGCKLCACAAVVRLAGVTTVHPVPTDFRDIGFHAQQGAGAARSVLRGNA